MKTCVIDSVCECQAKLFTAVDEQRHVVRGWARLRGRELPAPANALGGKDDTFHVGFSCPFCTRNTLRSFHSSALSFSEPTPSKAPPPLSR